MTDVGWAEKLVGYAGKIDWAAKAAFTHVTDESLDLSPNAANARIAQLLRAEHRRAVRAVKREIEATEKLRDTELRVDNVAAEAVYLDTIVALNKVLAALQRGRE